MGGGGWGWGGVRTRPHQAQCFRDGMGVRKGLGGSGEEKMEGDPSQESSAAPGPNAFFGPVRSES
jgi:hypothetical protein